MDPQAQFCHNPDCPARGQLGLGNLRVHSRKGRRYRCTTCGRTFAATHDTPLYRLKKPAELVTIVLTLLCHGCPLQAIVAAFGLDERTVAAWRDRAGRHGQHFHEHHVLNGQVELGHVPADELYVKVVTRRLWMAMAMAVPSRLWLGGVISPRRDLTLIMTVVRMVRRAARSVAFLVCVDGLASYVTAFARVFRDPIRTGGAGRPRLVPTAGLLLGQVIKHHAGRHLGRYHAPGRPGDRRGYHGGARGDRHRDGDQHGVHRATQRDLPQCVEPAGPPRPGDLPWRRRPDRGDVPGGVRLQLLLDP
jgi:transposase-like protein